MRSSKSDLRQVHRPKDKEKKNSGEGKLQPIRNMLQKVREISYTLFKKLDIRLLDIPVTSDATQQAYKNRPHAFLKCNGVVLKSSFYLQETSLKKKLTKKKKKKKKTVMGKEGEKDQEANDQEEEEEGDGNEGEQENSGQREKASSALIPPNKGKPKRKTKVKEETLDMPGWPDNDKRAIKG